MGERKGERDGDKKGGQMIVEKHELEGNERCERKRKKV